MSGVLDATPNSYYHASMANDNRTLSICMATDIAEEVEATARVDTRNRSQQIVHLVKLGLEVRRRRRDLAKEPSR